MAAKEREPRKKPGKNASARSASECMPELLENLRKSPGFPINLDMRYEKFVIGGHAMGGGKPQEDEATISVHRVVNTYCYALAAVRFTPEYWAEFKKMGDGLFKSLKKAKKSAVKKKK